MNRAYTSAVTLLLVVTGCTEPRHPNVILISIDCLNQRQYEAAVESGYAPTLASLADDSLVFSRAYAHAPWTTPSHMSMLTGLYPSQHGRDLPYGLMIEWNDYYDRLPAFDTMGDRLGDAGYETAAFVGQGSISSVYGIQQGFGRFEEHRKNRQLTDLAESIGPVTRWLDQREDKPFFLFFHTYDLHEPRPIGLMTDEETIRYIDQRLERVLIQLKSLGLYDGSLIILTGDHGSKMIRTEKKCCVHGAGHYEENIKVPLVVKLPYSTATGLESATARHVDLLPTVLEVAGLPDESFDGPGVSLLGRGDGDSHGLVSFSEADGRCAKRQALVSGRYKYIYTAKDATQALLQANRRFVDETCTEECRDLPLEEFYDLMKDPFETQNLLDGQLSPPRRDELERLRLEMAAHLNLAPHYTTSVITGPKKVLGDSDIEELRDSLRTLGYIP